MTWETILVATPLVRGIKEAFPESHISLGVGDWAARLLENNPYLDEVVHCNAPWHNKQKLQVPSQLSSYFPRRFDLCSLFSGSTLYQKTKIHPRDRFSWKQTGFVVI